MTIEHDSKYTSEEIGKMRQWLSDIGWETLENAYLYSDEIIISTVADFYKGGLDQFIKDEGPQ